jgi:hypothetical protein
LPARQAAKRVEIWRKLRRIGSLALPSSGYVLPGTPVNQEKLEWLAAAIRKYGGQSSVVTVKSFDDLPDDELIRRFNQARTADYEQLAKELRKVGGRSGRSEGAVARLRRRFQEISAIDFFDTPLRGRIEALLAKADRVEPTPVLPTGGIHMKKEFRNRVWVTRPRPGIDRSASAWLIRKFIDPKSKFTFAGDSKKRPNAVPFDMFGGVGFGHRGDDCTFETLSKEFGIHDRKVGVIAQIIHDADMDDEKFGRTEGLGLDRVLKGWAQQGITDDELLRRGMELIEGLYQAV